MLIYWRKYPGPSQQLMSEGRVRARFATAGGAVAEDTGPPKFEGPRRHAGRNVGKM